MGRREAARESPGEEWKSREPKVAETLYVAECPVKRHLTGPGQNSSLARMRAIQCELRRRGGRRVGRPVAGKQQDQTGDGQAPLTRVQNKRTEVRTPQARRQEVNDAPRLAGEGIGKSLTEEVVEFNAPVCGRCAGQSKDKERMA